MKLQYVSIFGVALTIVAARRCRHM